MPKHINSKKETYYALRELIGRRMKEKREHNRQRLSKIAKSVDISVERLEDFERGNVTLWELFLLARYLHTTLQKLIS